MSVVCPPSGYLIISYPLYLSNSKSSSSKVIVIIISELTSTVFSASAVNGDGIIVVNIKKDVITSVKVIFLLL